MDQLTDLKIRNAQLEADLAASQRRVAELEAALRQQDAEIDSLRHFDLEMTRSEDLDFVLNLVLTWTKERARADFVAVADWDTRKQALTILKTDGFALNGKLAVDSPLDLPRHMMPAPESDNLDNGMLIDPSAPHVVAEIRNADGGLMAVVDVRRHNQFRFTEPELRFVRSLADRLGVAMHMTTLLKKVQNLVERREQLFRMLSHDLRQPLTVLMGYLQLAEHSMKMGKTEPVAGYLQHVTNGAKDLADFLEEVLMMERIAGSSPEDWDTVDLIETLNKAYQKHKDAADLRQHFVETETPLQQAYCRGLSVEIKEAMSNYIGNAIKYTPDGGEIAIRLAPDQIDDLAVWVFEVIDNGHGISPERQAKLFQPFYRAQEPGTEDIKGSGLGLSLVKTIVENHLGEVYFDSTLGEGSRFGFWLPACDPPDAD